MVTFTVGMEEKHSVSFSYNTFTGAVKILVDGKKYKSSRVIFIGITPFTMQVGNKEKHNVRIELDNPLGFAFRGSMVNAFVDSKLVKKDMKAMG